MGTQISTMEPNLERAHIVYHMSTVRGMTRSQVSEETGLTMGQVARDVERYCRLTGAATISEWQAEQDAAHPAFDAQREDTATLDRGGWQPREFVGVDARREVLRRYLGTSYRPAPFHISTPVTVRRIVGAGDFHSNADPAVMRAIIDADPDIIVIGGDLGDNTSASRHPAETKADALRRRAVELHETQLADRAIVEELVDSTRAQIRIMTGNHDGWPLRAALQLMPDWVLDMFPEPLDMVCEGLKTRVSRVSLNVKHRFPDDSAIDTGRASEFLYRLGDTLFSHMNFTSSKWRPAVTKLYDWWRDWAAVLGLEDVRVFVHFHVHQRNMLNMEGGHRVLIEPGMAGLPTSEGYKVGYQPRGRPSVRGIVVLEQYQTLDGWATDMDSVQMVAPRMRTMQAVKRVEVVDEDELESAA